MALLRTTLRPTVLLTAVVFGATTLALPLRDARADNISPTGKGIVGGALLGAEVVTIGESLIGVRPGWAYVVGAIVGAGGGGVGGYFVEKGSSDGKAPMYMLAGGLGLIIPAFVLTLNATRFRPDEGATEDRAPIAPAAEPGVPGTSVTGAPSDVVAPPPPPPPETTPPTRGPQSKARPAARSGRGVGRAPVPPALSLVDVRGGDLRVGVPIPDVRPVFTVADLRQYGMRDQTELRLPVLHVAF
ncbi:MAG: hypothetical protein M3O46_03750 [Myxococcota bacterium]|nr:hypothetical protein [Myxococcota bacterium]